MPSSVNQSQDIYLRYEKIFIALKNIVLTSEQRVIGEETDDLFVENVNFFVKSYLVSICSYLEAYLQDIAFNYAQDMSNRIVQARIPHNYIHWRIDGIIDKQLTKKLKYGDMSLSISKKEISDNISGNPYKTTKLFQLLGLDLSTSDGFEKSKEIVNVFVNKRNNIIHHNDRAADISFSDLINYINVTLHYMKSIEKIVSSVE